MRRPRRAVAAVLGAGAVAGLVTACSKPAPQVTFLADNTVTRTPAQTYCFDAQHCRQDRSVRTIDASSSSTIMVNVPREVARQHWIVTAFRLDSSGKQSPMDGYGSPALLHDAHSTRVAVPYGTGDYYLSVAELRGAAQSGTWTVRVHVTG